MARYEHRKYEVRRRVFYMRLNATERVRELNFLFEMKKRVMFGENVA